MPVRRRVCYFIQIETPAPDFLVGKIMRLTIPKSQGKQPFYDARKSAWGDIFPHLPKNKPQERHQPKSRGNGEPAPCGDDIGKRKELYRERYYANVADGLKERNKVSKKADRKSVV